MLKTIFCIELLPSSHKIPFSTSKIIRFYLFESGSVSRTSEVMQPYLVTLPPYMEIFPVCQSMGRNKCLKTTIDKIYSGAHFNGKSGILENFKDSTLKKYHRITKHLQFYLHENINTFECSKPF